MNQTAFLVVVLSAGCSLSIKTGTQSRGCLKSIIDKHHPEESGLVHETMGATPCIICVRMIGYQF